MCSARPSFAPRVWAIVSVTSAGSRRAASPTQKTPALYSGTSVEAASSASRVLPEPPGPVSVTSRAPSSIRARTASSSRSLPTKELAGTREVRVRDRLEWGEALVAELEDGDRVLDVLQAMLAEVGERAVDELGRCLGEDDLPTMACRGDTGGEVHVLSHVALICDARRPRVQADTNMDRAWGERLSRRGGRRCRGRCRGEREEEGVPLRVHLDSVVCLAGRSHDPSMHRERLFVRLVPDLLEQPGRSLDVGEEEGDRAGREVVAHAG